LDPIHVGHVATALAARDALDLTTVVMLPSRVPPHRQQGPSASAWHRFAMAALAVNDLRDVTVSDEELSSDGPSYTALTLERMAARGLRPTQLFFITGADAFAEIETWYRYPAVLELAHFVVISRPGAPAGSIRDRLPRLGPRLRPAEHGMAIPSEPSVFLVDAKTPDVSSTDIRRRLRAHESITGLVPPSVERHIDRHKLYAETRTADQVR
ncbi:MAG: nicotinate (nicotinamide) nucleotide adenylyltransferase, partial [Vicinamibacterales bacterium]